MEVFYFLKEIKTVYFISYAKLPNNTSAGALLDYIGLGLYINYETGVIEDVAITLLTDEAKVYLKDLMVGFNLHESPLEDLVKRIEFHYHGMSQKAIIVVLKAVYERYCHWKKENLTI